MSHLELHSPACSHRLLLLLLLLLQVCTWGLGPPSACLTWTASGPSGTLPT
jgi:hypothetical protein